MRNEPPVGVDLRREIDVGADAEPAALKVRIEDPTAHALPPVESDQRIPIHWRRRAADFPVQQRKRQLRVEGNGHAAEAAGRRQPAEQPYSAARVEESRIGVETDSRRLAGGRERGPDPASLDEPAVRLDRNAGHVGAVQRYVGRRRLRIAFATASSARGQRRQIDRRAEDRRLDEDRIEDHLDGFLGARRRLIVRRERRDRDEQRHVCAQDREALRAPRCEMSAGHAVHLAVRTRSRSANSR